MNDDDPLSSRSSAVYRQKANLLSTYLVSDEEDDEPNESLHERIQVLTSSSSIVPPIRSSSSQMSTLNSIGCESNNSSFDASNHNRIPSNLWSDDTIDSSTPRRSQYRITFEIIKAKTITAIENGIGRRERRKYVSYTVLIKRVPGLETKPAVIERRYSDFLNFYNEIRKRYSSLMKDVIFPKKILIGNFSLDLIQRRSLEFKNFLAYSLSVPEIRSSREFASFLYFPELKAAKVCLQSIYLEEAGNILENVYFIQDKLAIHSGLTSGQLVHTLCCLIGCYNAVDNTAEAKRLAERTFEILFNNSVVCIPNNNRQDSSVYEVTNLFETSELILPLIMLSLRLRWFSGQQKISLENKLEELCRQRSLPRNFDSQPTLLEMILKKDFSLILDWIKGIHFYYLFIV